MTNIIISILIGLGALGASSYYAYDKGFTNGGNAEKIALQKEIDRINEQIKRKNGVIANLSRNLEISKSTQKQIEKDSNEKATKELSNPVYSQCIVPSNGVRNLSETATKLNSIRNSGKSADGLPRDK